MRINIIRSYQEMVRQHPDRIAMVDNSGERRTTYGELDVIARKTVTYLQSRALPAHSFIPIMMPSCMEYMAVELGVWMAGHAIVPLGDNFPEARVDYIREHCEAPLVISAETLQEILRCEAFQGETVSRKPEEVAALFYTSGSTGNPKGIIHTFASIEFSMNCQIETSLFRPDDVFGTGAPYYFVAVLFIYNCLHLGATVHLYPPAVRTDVHALEAYLSEEKITSCFISPSVLANYKNKDHALRAVITGSERLAGIAPDGYELWNSYGLTETGACVVFYKLDKMYDNTPIGKPSTGVEVCIMDDDGNQLQPGEEGEICMKGIFTPCYFKEPEKTDALWRGGWLHTGDLGRQLPDGNYIYVNRKDWMVKINGQRVEPGEIEAVMKQIPGIDNAIVKGFVSDTGSQYLCAYYISPTGIDEEVIKKELSKALPPYMIPSFFLKMDSFPLNQNGKLNRKILLPPERSSLQAEYAAPQNETERRLCEAFATALNLKRVGIDDDFFRLGGDSIRVMKVLKLCDGLPLSTKLIYLERTPRKIAGQCAGNEMPDFEPCEENPLSRTQLGIYMECMKRVGEAAYNNPRLYKLGKEVDLPRLAMAVERVVEAHPHINTRLSVNEEGIPVQHRTGPEYRQSIETLTDAAFTSLVPELVQPFDLLSDRLFRIRLIRTDSAAYLFMDFHHIIYDGTSSGVLLQDLEAAYNGNPLEAEPWSGFEIAREEEFLRQTDTYGKAEKWYQENFGSLDADSMPIPDRDGTEVRFGKETFPLSIDYKHIEAFCDRYGITPNVLTTAAFGYLLGIYSNADESLFASIYNGRSDMRTSRTIGMLVKTLPVYCHWKEETSVQDFLSALKEQMIGSMTHDIYSFAELRAMNSSISSKVLFAYQGDLPAATTIGGCPFEEIHLLENATGEPLTVQVFRKGSQLELVAEYHENSYSPGFIRRMLGCYDCILDGMLKETSLSQIALLDAKDLSELDALNATEAEYDDSQTLISLFRKQVSMAPDHIALVCNGREITYREVDELSERIGQYIIHNGIKPGSVVSILIPRCEYMAIASIGVMKARCTYQPLDPTYPAERLNFMMKDADAQLLIADESLRPIVSEYDGKVLLLDDIPTLPDSGEALPDIAPEDYLILLYTSGSTGQPKGCRLTHRNVVAFCNWYCRFYQLKPEDRVGAYASYGFDANMMDMYPALTSGSTCCVIGEDIRLDFNALYEFMERNRITHQFMTTQAGRQFASEFKTHPTLRYLSIGGEKLVPLDLPEGYRFYNVYGPTEGTIYATAYEIACKEKNIPIGKPLSNVKLYVTDRVGRRLPIGAVGELWMAGRQVAHGYFNREEQTRKVFITNPFDHTDDYSRVYRTGDVVRYREDGNIEFIGRRDFQVKIRGFRIELSEIEAVIREFEGIEDATVAAFEDGDGGKFIAAYVVSSSPVDITALNNFIRSRKPPYMVPAVTMQIDRIPLNQNMKVNRKALPVPERKRPEASGNESRPLNLLEQELLDIVKQVLRTDEVSVTDDLGYAGLTSISAIKLSMMIFKRFNISLPVKTLITEASIQSIGNEIIRNWMQGMQNGTSATSAATHEIRRTYPLSYAQQGVYYDCMKHPAEIIYNIPLMLSFHAGTDVAGLENAAKEVIMAHPYVMTRFEMQDNEVVQVREEQPVRIACKEMSEEQLSGYKKEFVRPFNLSCAPLFRLEIVRTESRVCLLSDFHHLVFDGSSLDIFFKDLKQKMEGGTVEQERYSYYDYILDEKDAEQTTAYAENKAFFDTMLKDFESASELTPDLNGKPENGKSKDHIHYIDREQVDRFCSTHRVTPAALCLSAAAYTVARYTGSRQVYLSTISSGRSDARTSDSFGMFVKTLPLGITVGDQSVKDFVVQSGHILTEAVAHENYPFAKIASDYGFSPKIMYACQLGLLEEWSISGHPVAQEPLELSGAKFNLSIHIEEVEGRTAIVLQYNDALYSPTLIEGFATSMANALSHIMATPEEQITHISLLDKEQEEQIGKFREEGRATIETHLFHEALERQAGLHPEHTALIASDGTYTYAELNSSANRIAHALMERGVAPHSRIALLLPRTSRFILSMFGVMKTGSAYIPCDPAYPAERISHILNDSGAAYVITTSLRVQDFPEGKALDVETLLRHPDTSNPQVDITPEDLAYLIYTSGSTGTPKGVMLKHKGICNYLTDHPVNRHVHALVSDAHVFLSVTTISFDMSLKEIGTTLFNGLTLVFADETRANNPVLLADLFEQTGADAFNATPSRLLQYMELPAFCKALSKCKVIMCGGEKFTDILLERLQELTDARIFNTYGPTEITVSSNCKELTHAREISIGRPLLNYKEYIVDMDGNELPVGVTGELYIGGTGVSAGYNGLEELTRKQFIEYRGERIYKSGDYARWTAEGDVVVLGRTDSQVKLRGLRIELGEIESTLTRIPEIGTAVVVIRSIHGNEHLCAYFTADRPVNIVHLKDKLRKTLAPYMVPDAYKQMEQMPLTPNGKTDLKSLPEAELSLGGEGVEAQGEMERCLCRIFAEILGTGKVGATDSFFDLGGTSLAVARIIIEADKAGLKVAYGDVFSHPTPRRLAALLESSGQTAETDKEITGYDYEPLQHLLEANTIDSFLEGTAQPIGNILLTGSTGFLGVHLLKEFIETQPGNVYCLLRGKQGMPADVRLKSVLFYYFENSYDELFGKRIFTVEGDITQPHSLDSMAGKEIDTVFNCAANVKHYSEGTDIEDVNLGGTANLIRFCLQRKARLVQVSTMSVGGLSVDGNPSPRSGLTENMLYFGQYIENKYIRSKFLAERLILENMKERGLNAKIMRVGNLSPRNSDGEFQMNYSTNSSMGRLKSYRLLGKCTYGQLDVPMEFSPIDEVAKAILLLSTTPEKCCLFHPYNHHYILYGDIFEEMRRAGFPIDAVEAPEFAEALTEAEADPVKARVLSSMIAYRDMAHGKVAIPIPKNNAYTMQVLYRLGYRWPVTSWQYVTRFLNALQGLGFFDL